MRKKLDSENLGIILLNAFMDEFFPKEESSVPDMFTLFHYNGLANSNVNGQVSFRVENRTCTITNECCLGTLPRRVGNTPGNRCKIDMRIESHADLPANKMAERRSKLVRQRNTFVELILYKMYIICIE